MSLIPARFTPGPANTPYSLQFDDVYHTASGGLGQARHVFIAGNELAARWKGRRTFTVLETGFGLGLNFLATWHAWAADADRCQHLHFASVEKHPLTRHDLARVLSDWPELAPQAAHLLNAWPNLVPGIHRFTFEQGRVVLSLALGDALQVLPELTMRADAFYLDGFSPDRNPDMWSPAIFTQLARLAAPGATLSTWCVAGHVRRGVQEAGFIVERQPGFGGKRHMLAGRFPGPGPKSTGIPDSHRALVIGAGVAGTSVAERLAARDWQITLIDSADAPGQGASGNRAGVFRPLPSLDDNRLARLTRAGFLYGRQHLTQLAERGHPVRWAPTGVLHLARDAKQENKMRAVVEAQQPPDGYLRYVTQEEAARLADWPVSAGGWWFPGGGWIQPPSLCAASLAAGGTRIIPLFGRTLARLERRDGEWAALDADGHEIARAPIAILANGVGLRAVPEAAMLPVRPARGQVSHLPAASGSAPGIVVCRLGYVSPEVDGVRCAGATFVADDLDPQLRDSEHRDNLAKLDFILPGYAADYDPATLDGRVGFRPASPDRLPMVGAIPAVAPVDRTTPLADIPRQPGLFAVSGFGARGLVWASLMGELLASQLNGDPLPLERDLMDAIDPARYLLKPPRPMRGEDG